MLGTTGIVLFNEKIKAYIINKIVWPKRGFISKIIDILVETFSVTLSAQIIVTPISIYYFNTFSLVSVISNLIIIPVIGSVSILGIMMYMISLISMPMAKIISYSIYFFISFLLVSSNFFAKIPSATILLPTPSIMHILIYYLLLYKIFYSNSRIINCIICVIISVPIISNFIPKSYVNLNMIDVGQGDAVYIETQNRKTILIDSGGSENSEYNIGEKILIPYMLDRGHVNINYIFLSHMHEDHVEGAITLIKERRVDNIIIGKQDEANELYIQLLNLADIYDVNIIIANCKDKFNIDNIEFEVISVDERNKNLNNTSLVLRMTFGKTSVLFTGDIEREIEEKIDVNANILKVPHHGSKTSTGESFLNKVLPQIAIIGVGKDNSYGHPSKEIIKRLQKENIKIYRTDKNGEIYMRLYKNGKIRIKTHVN